MGEKIVEPLTKWYFAGAGLYGCMSVQKVNIIVSLYLVYMLALV